MAQQQQMMGQMPMMPPQMGQPLPQNQNQLRPCIYVGDLEENINEQMLFNFFSKYGQIYAVKVMRDKYNKKSRGFAFVQFWQPKEAETAIKLANHERILKKEIRVCWKKNIREFSTEANVYIKNVDKNVTIKELDSQFSQYGTILSSKLSLDEKGQSLGYGYIQFAAKEQADKCIKEANNKLRIQNNVVEVLPFQQKKTRPDNRNNLYIKNLPTNRSQEELTNEILQKFGQHGEITSCKVAKHQEDDQTQQFYAFICFKENSAAEKVYKEFQDADPFNTGTKLYINWHEDKRTRQNNLKQFYSGAVNETNLFTKNLKEDVTAEQLKAIFEKHFNCEITKCAVSKIKQSESNVSGTVQTELKQGEEPKSLIDNEEQKQPPQFYLPPHQQHKQYPKTKFGYMNFNTKEAAREALSKFKLFEDITELYFDGKSFLNYHIKKDQFQQFKQTNNRNKDQLLFGAEQISQQMIYQRFAQMQMLYMMQQQMMFAQMQNFYGMGMPNQNMRQHMGGYGNLPSNQYRGHQNKAPNQRQQNRPYQKKGGRPNPRYNHKRGQQYIQYQQKQVQQPQSEQQGGQQNAAAAAASGAQQQQQQIQLPPVFVMTGLTIQTLKDNMQEFLKLGTEKQRTLLGELIFPTVSKFASTVEIAPKITGMLIDLDVFEVTDILEFLENEQQLQERIREAEDLIKNESSIQNTQ